MPTTDGKHVNVKALARSASDYFNYKKQFSIVLMALVVANYEFIYVNIGAEGTACQIENGRLKCLFVFSWNCTGRISDGGVFAGCSFARPMYRDELHLPSPRPLNLRTTPFVILADNAFPLHKHIMKQYSFKNQTAKERIFNYRLFRGRRSVENAFGIASARFRILQRTSEFTSKRASKIVSVVCVLHNFLLSRESCHLYAPIGTHDSLAGTDGSWRRESGESILDAEDLNLIETRCSHRPLL
ncbi:uncharacterized protein LOC129728629 [Wyeomyia smithii]|uniref:uncharacterized protein LOC129728629 n=1 Tax=Wyeomyia smithii TaxID=174621 RepID=UPI002467AD6D|nr:uncharacterized protein LOC129728629 [Wyeomyia smithii]